MQQSSQSFKAPKERAQQTEPSNLVVQDACRARAHGCFGALRVTFVLGGGLSVEPAVVVEHREVKVAVVLPVRTQHLLMHSQPWAWKCQATILVTEEFRAQQTR